MANVTSKRTAWLAPGLTVAALALFFGLFYLHYVPSRRAALVEQDFRLLADMGDQIRDSLTDLQISLLSATAPLAENADVNASTSSNNPAQNFSNHVAQIQPPVDLVEFACTAPSNDFVCCSVQLEHLLTQTWLRLSYSNSTGSNRFAVKADLAELLQPILRRYAFGDILLADTNGEVLFQKSQAESRASNPKSRSGLLIQRLGFFAGGKGTNLASQMPSLAEIPIGGDKYKVFSQPLTLALGSNEASRINWLVCGLAPARELTRQTWQAPPTVTVIFLIFAGAVLLSWPLLNIIFSPPSARLRRGQVILVLASSFFICSSLTGILLYANALVSAEKQLDKKEPQLASEVRDHLIAELEQVNALLSQFDERLREKAATNLWSHLRQKGDISDWVPEVTNYPTFSDVFWMNRGGAQVAKWVPRKHVPELVQVGDRDYFRSIRDRWGWPWRNFAPSGTNLDLALDLFFVESIFSRTRNENIAIFSHRFSPSSPWPPAAAQTNRPLVSAMAFQPVSLFNPVLPAGYGFCVIEPSGRVLFHSDSGRNLRENFLVETGQDRRLHAALQSRTHDDFDGSYLNQPYHLTVEPVPDTPWSVVAFRDERLLGGAHRKMVLTAVILFCFYACFVFLLLLFGPLWRRRRLRKRNLSQSWFYWLWPSHDLARYVGYLILAAVAAVVCFAGIACSRTVSWLMFWGILAPITFALARLVISPFRPVDPPGRSSGQATNTTNREPGRLEAFSERLVSMVRRIAGWFAPYFEDRTVAPLPQASNEPPDRLHTWRQELRLKVTTFLAGVQKPPWPSEVSFQHTRRAHIGSVALALILLAMLPSFACYKIAFLNETGALVKGVQLRLGRELQEPPVRMRSGFRRRDSGSNSEYWSALREFRRTNVWNHYYQVFLNTTVRTNERVGPVTNQPAVKVYKMFRPRLEEDDLPTAGLLASAADDDSWESGPEKTNRMALTLRGIDAQRPWYHISSDFPTAGLISGPWPLPFSELNWSLGWYAGALLLAVIPFALAGFMGRRIFLLNLSRPAATEQDQDYDCFWRYCTDEQKQTLYQIARYGFVHPDRAQAMKGALQRGWVRFNPELAMEEKFRAYVLKNFHEDPEAQAAAGAGSPFGWLSLRGAVGIVITAVALFLFATQAEVWQLVVAFSGAFATIAQQLPKLSWFFSGKKESE